MAFTFGNALTAVTDGSGVGEVVADGSGVIVGSGVTVGSGVIVGPNASAVAVGSDLSSTVGAAEFARGSVSAALDVQPVAMRIKLAATNTATCVPRRVGALCRFVIVALAIG